MNSDAIHKYEENQEEQILLGEARSECFFLHVTLQTRPSHRYVNRRLDL